MTVLVGMYKNSLANNMVHLMKNLFNLKMLDGTFVIQHLNEFNSITNKLLLANIDFNDEIKTLIMLASLSSSWESTRMTVGNFADNMKFSYDSVYDTILAEEV